MDEALSMSSMIFLLEAYPHRAGVETRCITAPSALSRDFWQGALVRKMQPRAIQSFVSRWRFAGQTIQPCRCQWFQFSLVTHGSGGLARAASMAAWRATSLCRGDLVSRCQVLSGSW